VWIFIICVVFQNLQNASLYVIRRYVVQSMMPQGMADCSVRKKIVVLTQTLNYWLLGRKTPYSLF